MLKRNIEGKQDAMDDYRSTELDSLQAQVNALRTKIDQFERRFKRLDNKFTIHVNAKQGHKEVHEE